MNRNEAFEEMKNGNKIKHKYFTSKEYFYFENDKIISEDGIDFSEIFWEQEMYMDNWTIFK